MTILGTIGNVFATGDRIANSLLRLAADGRGVQPIMLPIPAGRPVQLADRDGQTQLISYGEIVGNYPTVYGVWSKLTRTLATTEIGVFEDAGQGREKQVFDTDLEALLRQPAPDKGLVDLLTWMFSPYFAEGNSLLGLYQPDGRKTPPQAIIPLDWRFMSAWSMPGGPVEMWVSNQLGDPRELFPEDVIHLAWPSPDNSPIGLCPLQPLGTAVRLHDSADRFQIASFDNGSRPLGVFVLPPDADLDDQSRKDLRERAEMRHKGVDNAFKIGVLSGGVKWEKMSFSAVEADLVQTRNASEARVFTAYDMRRGVLEDSDTGTLGVSQERNRDFQRTLIPHARYAENVIANQLIRRVPEWKGLKVRLDLSELQRGTFREEVETAAYGYTSGIFSEDDARARIGLAPSGNPGADKPRVPHAQLDPADGRNLPPSSETPPGRDVRQIPPAPSAGSS